MAGQERYQLDFASLSWKESRTESKMQVKAQWDSRPISKEIRETTLSSLPWVYYKASVIPSLPENQVGALSITEPARGNQVSVWRGSCSAQEGRSAPWLHGLQWLGEWAIFLCLKCIWHLYDLWHTCLFCSPVMCIEYWFCNEKFAGVSEWASRTPCPSADDRKDWEAGPFVSLMVYKGQMLICGQLLENFHLKQSSGKMYLNPQNGALSVLTMEESQWLQSVKCCSAYLGSGRNIYH